MVHFVCADSHSTHFSLLHTIKAHVEMDVTVQYNPCFVVLVVFFLFFLCTCIPLEVVKEKRKQTYLSGSVAVIPFLHVL
jgi:hypothetical protein